jgi:hypothetical protein
MHISMPEEGIARPEPMTKLSDPNHTSARVTDAEAKELERVLPSLTIER